MDRAQFCLAMAKRVGQTLTPQSAVEIINEAQTALALEPTMREKVQRLEDSMLMLPQVHCKVRHIFAPHMCAREMTIPAGVTTTGAVHKTEHMSVLSAGHCLLTTDDGVVEIRAPHTSVSKPGIKRALHAFEECVFTTFHPTEETDLAKVIAEISETPLEELIGGPKNRQLLQQAEQQRLEA